MRIYGEEYSGQRAQEIDMLEVGVYLVCLRNKQEALWLER